MSASDILSKAFTTTTAHLNLNTEAVHLQSAVAELEHRRSGERYRARPSA